MLFRSGSIFVSKIQQMAMSRQRMKESERRDFWVYLDEFHSFITPSMAEILTGARKYRVGLVLAHQELHQLEADREVASAVLANCCTRVAFRVSDRDARELDSGFAHFAAGDLQNLGVGEAICRVERSEADFNLSVCEPEDVDEAEAASVRDIVMKLSNEKYARPRRQVEADLLAKIRGQDEEQTPVARKRVEQTQRDVSGTVSEKESASTTGAAPQSASVAEQSAESAPGKTSASAPVVSESASCESAVTPVIEPAAVSETAPIASQPRPVGKGRGGEDHQLIVGSLASEATRLGFRTIRECVVAGGRVDLVIENSRRRIAVEVAVNSNTAHEIENLQKCVDSKPDFIASVSPHENVRENISKAAGRTFDSEMFARMRFDSSESFIGWLQEMAETETEVISPDVPKTRVIAGRKVQARHVEMSPEEQRKKDAEEIELIADLLKNRGSKRKEDSE